MTETSYFWNGTVNRDAKNAPYSSEAFHGLINRVISTDGVYVLPDNANMLECTTDGATRSVDINTGAALVYGRYYKNTASKNLILDTNPTSYPRWDRVVLVMDEDAQTIRLQIVKGASAKIPELPPCTTCGIALPLWKIYLPAGYATVDDEYIFDERAFAHNVVSQNNYSTDNLVPDSQFMGALYNYAPNWIATYNIVTGVTGITAYGTERFSTARQGRALKVTMIDETQTYTLPIVVHENDTVPTTMRVLLKQNTVMEPTITWASVAKKIPRYTGEFELIIRASDTGTLDLVITAETGSSSDEPTIVELAEPTVAIGYIPATITYEQEEYVILENPGYGYAGGINLSAFTYSSNSNSTKTTTLYSTDIITSLGHADEVLGPVTGTKALIVLLGGRDSGSAAAATPYVAIRTPTLNGQDIVVRLGGVGNDIWNYEQGILYLEEENFTGENAFKLEVDLVATGAGTLDYTIQLIGVII